MDERERYKGRTVATSIVLSPEQDQWTLRARRKSEIDTMYATCRIGPAQRGFAARSVTFSPQPFEQRSTSAKT
jgi:hypothetical protein